MNRQQRRAAEKRRKKGDPNQIMSDQVALFGKLPEACDACQKEFDKKDRDMVMSWSVVVKQEVVRLFCPDCIQKTQQALQTIGEENGNENRQEVFTETPVWASEGSDKVSD
jgi:hypothetical protein